MALRDLASNVTVRQSLAPAARTTAANGTGIDTLGYDSVTFVLDFGAVADGYFQFGLEESDSQGSGFTAIAASDLIGSAPDAFGGSPASGASTSTKVGYKGDKQFVRVTLSQGLSPAPATGAVAGGTVLLGHAHSKPTAD